MWVSTLGVADWLLAKIPLNSRLLEILSRVWAHLLSAGDRLGDPNTDVMVKKRDTPNRKAEDDAFARILAGKLAPANHPFAVCKKTPQYNDTLFQPGRVYMQIWFHQSMNQPITDKSGDTLYDIKWQYFLSRMEILSTRTFPHPRLEEHWQQEY